MYSWDKFKLEPITSRIFGWLLLFRRKRVLSGFGQAFVELEKNIEMIALTTTHAARNSWADIKTLWNVAGFICVVSLDLKILGSQLIAAKHLRDERLTIKHSCILIFEVLEDLDQIMNGQFFQAVERLSVSEAAITEIKAKKKELSRFRQTHSQDLNKVRTIVGAHREHNFLGQIEVLQGLQKEPFLQFMIQFDTLIQEMSKPLQKAINESTETFARQQATNGSAPGIYQKM